LEPRSIPDREAYDIFADQISLLFQDIVILILISVLFHAMDVKNLTAKAAKESAKDTEL
jgi:hypothetical protein